MTDILKQRLQEALDEDCPRGDITTAFFTEDRPVEAYIFSKEAGVFFGKEVITAIFPIVNKEGWTITIHVGDGQVISPQTKLCTILGPLHGVLRAERVLLNLLQKLSGIATQTSRFVQTLNDPHIHILDTRKTTPLWRFLEKKAVVAGGGVNHRSNLSTMVLLKENHLVSFSNRYDELTSRAFMFKKQKPDLKIEVEVETLDQLRNMDLSWADYIMFDNFSIQDIEPAVTICKDKKWHAKIEVSGNITLENIAQYRGLPIQRISIGSLTHSVKALDLSLIIV
jgi:nicotinate-nucleotide pyrophosphorylase (carboxylating)